MTAASNEANSLTPTPDEATAKLRDSFAIEAMRHVQWRQDTVDAAAQGCYLVADAMLKARQQGGAA